MPPGVSCMGPVGALRSSSSFAVRPGPGVIVGTVLTAALVKYTFPYNWNWVESLLFGAMFSATDPVAVVAVLKEVKLPHISCILRGYSTISGGLD